MSRYADVEWLKTEFDEANEICFFYLNTDSRGAFEELKKIVEQAPSIDIIYCQECKHWHSGICWGIPFSGDDASYIETVADDFCSYGERKDDE